MSLKNVQKIQNVVLLIGLTIFPWHNLFLNKIFNCIAIAGIKHQVTKNRRQPIELTSPLIILICCHFHTCSQSIIILMRSTIANIPMSVRWFEMYNAVYACVCVCAYLLWRANQIDMGHNFSPVPILVLRHELWPPYW